MNRFLRSGLGLLIAMTLIAGSFTAYAQTAQDPLVQVLVQKGVLTAEDAKAVSGTPAEQRDRLAEILKQKGVITDAEYATVSAAATPAAPAASSSPFSIQPVRVNGTTAAPTIVPAVYAPQAKEMPKEAPKPPAPTFIPAVAPVRVLQLDPAKPGGLIPDIKLGSGAKLKLYGFLKASAAYDTSSPYGNDFPLPGFLGPSANLGTQDVGPSLSPEFHLKARAARIGGNFEFPDFSSKVAITGKLEADYEGDFTRVANRNVSAIRSSQMSLRLAWGRLDYKWSDRSSLFFLAGQDWTTFGSSILPNMLETTIYGVGFGNLYEREPQFRVGMTHNFGGDRKFTFAPEFAITLPGWGNTPTNLAINCPVANRVTVTTPTGTTTVCNIATGTSLLPGSLGDQLAYGERQGPDSAKPGLEGRLVFQFQADKAKGVAPAQIVVSGMHRNRTVIVPRSLISAYAPTSVASLVPIFFPRGAELDTDSWGGQVGFSIPTRWATFQAQAYRGTGLRWYFEGQLYQEYNVTTGLANTFTPPDIDGAAGGPVFGVNTAGQLVMAKQFEPRAQGGFAEIGLPLSRWFNANPAGRNAGWTMNVHYGYDSVLARDVRKLAPAGGRGISDLAFVNLNWKFNQFVTFGLEESYYRTRAIAGTAGQFPVISGLPSRQWHDVRTEFATIFTF